MNISFERHTPATYGRFPLKYPAYGNICLCMYVITLKLYINVKNIYRTLNVNEKQI